MTTTLPSTGSAAPPVTFDPELAAAWSAVAELIPAAITPEIIPAMRAGALMVPVSDEELRRDGRFTIEERQVPGLGGDPDISLLICTPTGITGTLGCFYHIHGGGMIMSSNRTGVPELLDWAEEFGMVLVSVEYRLAPETPHPGPVNDCYAGLIWTAGSAGELGYESGRLIVEGPSAGGGLAAAVTLMARDKDGPDLAGQMLLCPMLDDRNDSWSTLQQARSGGWDRTANNTGWTALLGDARGGPDVSPYAAPARETDLSGLPPAFIDVGSAETFRDEDVAYATRIWQAGGNAELHVWPGGFHGFDFLAPQATISQDAKAARVRWLHRLLDA